MTDNDCPEWNRDDEGNCLDHGPDDYPAASSCPPPPVALTARRKREREATQGQGSPGQTHSCTCDRKGASFQANPDGHRSDCPAAPNADYYRAKLRELLSNRTVEPPGVPCLYCGAEGDWCESDCGSPFPIRHPDFRKADG